MIDTHFKFYNPWNVYFSGPFKIFEVNWDEEKEIKEEKEEEANSSLNESEPCPTVETESALAASWTLWVSTEGNKKKKKK